MSAAWGSFLSLSADLVGLQMSAYSKIGNIKDIVAAAGSCVWDKLSLLTLGTALGTGGGPALAYLSLLLQQCAVNPATQATVLQQLSELLGVKIPPPPPPAPKPGTGRLTPITNAEQLEALRNATATALARQLLGKPCTFEPGVLNRCFSGTDGKNYSGDEFRDDLNLPREYYESTISLVAQAALGGDKDGEMVELAKAAAEAELKKLGKSLNPAKTSTKSKLQQQSYLVKAGMGIAAGVAALVLAIYIGKQLKKA